VTGPRIHITVRTSTRVIPGLLLLLPLQRVQRTCSLAAWLCCVQLSAAHVVHLSCRHALVAHHILQASAVASPAEGSAKGACKGHHCLLIGAPQAGQVHLSSITGANDLHSRREVIQIA
jgi:hypothetical protein